MAEPHLDHPGEISWFKGHGPLPVLAACPHRECRHLGQGVIAHGPSFERYELVACGSITPADEGPSDCAMRCRAWVDDHGRVRTPWLMVACCDLHGEHCEPPGDLCCARCSEVGHPEHPIGVRCSVERETR